MGPATGTAPVVESAYALARKAKPPQECRALVVSWAVRGVTSLKKWFVVEAYCLLYVVQPGFVGSAPSKVSGTTQVKRLSARVLTSTRTE